MINCNYISANNATYKYEDSKLVMTPKTRVELTVPAEAIGVKIFLWDDIDDTLRPIAPESICGAAN